MSINIIAMVQRHDNTTVKNVTCNGLRCENKNDTKEYLDTFNDDGEIQSNGFDWSSEAQGVILGAFFWGQLISCAPGGLIAEKYGPTKTIFFTMLVASACNCAIPAVAEIHWTAVVAFRFVMGLMGGVVYPSLHCLISKWAPPEEKGKFVGALLGGSLGTVLTWPLLGLLIEQWGWSWAFFVPAFIAALWSWLWNICVSDMPSLHKGIKDTERKYIEESLKASKVSTNDGVLPPYLRILSSLATWALIVAHFGNCWGLFFLMTSGPRYMATVLGFNLSGSGLISALPYLARMLFGIFFGLLGDNIKKRNWMSTTAIRKSFIVFSHILPGIFLFLLILTESNVVWSVALITFSLGLNGAATITNLANSQDLTSTYSGSLYGIISTIGTTTGFLSPLVTGYITREQNGIPEWRIIFFISGSIYILSGFCFIVFGSGENQHWEEKPNSSIPKGIENMAFEKDSSSKKNDLNATTAHP